MYTYKQIELNATNRVVLTLCNGHALDYCALSTDNQATWTTAHTATLELVRGSQPSSDVHDALDLALDLHYEA